MPGFNSNVMPQNQNGTGTRARLHLPNSQQTIAA